MSSTFGTKCSGMKWTLCCVKCLERSTKVNVKNNPKNNAKTTKRLLVAKQTTHNNLLESTVPVQNVAWTDANPLDRDAAFASAFTKAVSLVETALRSNCGS